MTSQVDQLHHELDEQRQQYSEALEKTAAERDDARRERDDYKQQLDKAHRKVHDQSVLLRHVRQQLTDTANNIGDEL